MDESGISEYTNEYGRSWIAPWESRGNILRPREDVPPIEELLPDLRSTDKMDLCESVADYYLLDGTINGLFKSDYLTHNHAVELHKSLVDVLDCTLVSYFQMAIGGELRHHRALFETVLSSEHQLAASGWCLIYEIVGPQALLDAALLFREYSYGLEDPENCVFGGEYWAQAAELLHARLANQLGPTEFTNKQVFVDMSFALQHNTGSFLTKLPWHEQRLAVRDIHKLLDCRSGPNPCVETLRGYASGHIRNFTIA